MKDVCVEMTTAMDTDAESRSHGNEIKLTMEDSSTLQGYRSNFQTYKGILFRETN